MPVISENFPLIGTRDYVHSTTLLTYLDQFTPSDLPQPKIDLRLRQKLRPSVRVFIDEALKPDAVATAQIGKKSISFVNSEVPVDISTLPDSFDNFMCDITHAAGRTTIRRPLQRDASASETEIWPRLLFAAKRHLMLRHVNQCHKHDAANFLLTRISCRKPHPQEAIEITTDVVIGDNWFRLYVTGDQGLVGNVFGALST